MNEAFSRRHDRGGKGSRTRSRSSSVTQMVGIVDELMYAARMSGKNRLEKRVVGA
jgi:hypothetical protein